MTLPAKGSSAREFGAAELDPRDDVIAGSRGTWRLTYTAGSRGIRPGGKIRIYCDGDTDRALPQFNDPSGPDYTTVQTPDGVQVDTLVQPYKTLLLTLHGAPLRAGDCIIVTFGDPSGGSPGLRSQTYLESRHTYDISVAPTAEDAFHPLSDSPFQTIVGGDIDRLVVVAPSTAAVDRPFRLLVKPEDAWGHPLRRVRHTRVRRSRPARIQRRIHGGQKRHQVARKLSTTASRTVYDRSNRRVRTRGSQ